MRPTSPIKKLRAVLCNSGGERGIVLISALLVMIVLLPLGVIFLKVAFTENIIASNEVETARGFYLAEAGIEHAKKRLESLDLSEVLDGTTDVFPGGNSATLGGGSYTVQVTNNIAATGFPRGTVAADPSGSATVDGDGIIVVTSTGSFQQVVETTVRISSFPPVPGGVVQVSNGTNEFDVEDNTLASGFEESGTCPDRPGFVWRGAAVQLDLEGGTLEGVPVASREYDPALDDPLFDDPAQLLNLVNQWASSPGVVTISGDSPPATLGTAANPQITVWSANIDIVKPPYAPTGYGVLIVDGELYLETEFEFHGLIVVKTSRQLTLGKGGGSYNQYVHGAIIAVSTSSSSNEATKIDLENQTQVLYNCSALQTYASSLVSGSGSGTASVLSWRPVSG